MSIVVMKVLYSEYDQTGSKSQTMAAPDSVKAFSPEKAQQILRHLQQPAVFTDMTDGWPALRWTAEHLSGCLHKLIRFRLGRKEETNTPLFETQCSYVEATLEHFLSWTRGQAEGDVGPLCEYPKSDYWAYADYKYIALLFQDQPAMFEDVQWSEFGFEGRNGRESTVWIGTEGANTPCHQDSYGCNLVLQVQGRKRWHIFPPRDTVHLYPTRIPYEESSVFSQVDVLRPDLRRFPAFHRAGAHIVTLQPGQVLYVPRHWWHYVESLDPITVSINSWIEMEEDDVARVGEAVTKAVVCAFKRDEDPEDWLNPTEEGVASHDENMQCVNLAVRACAQRQGGSCHRKAIQDPRDSRTLKRDSSGQIRRNSNLFSDSAPFSIPFGPHLIPVCCQQEYSLVTEKHLEVKPSRNSEVKSPEACTVSSDAAQRTAAVRVQQDKHECSGGSNQSTPRDGAVLTSHISSEDYEEPVHRTITTNDLLDCLLHPDIIARVAELLLERQTDSHRDTAPSQL